MSMQMPDPNAQDPNAGGGLPPALMSAIQGGGGGAPTGPGLQGPGPTGAEGPNDPTAEPAPEGGSGDNIDFLQTAIDSAKAYADGEDDQLHVQTALQCIAKLQKILADEQASSDNMLQGKSTPRSMRKALSGGGGQA